MITKPKGTQDILPNEVKKWVKLEEYLRRVCMLYNYKEIRTPIFESSELFHRQKDDTSDMVTKETYDFIDRGSRPMTLRPEGTAPTVRSYIENKLYVENPVAKLFYIGPIFRYERPQAGRQRQFHQFGIEAYGSNSPLLDCEVIALACSIIKGLGLKGIKVKINTLGDEESRDNYRKALVNHFSAYEDDLCSDCKVRLHKNPLRLLDCKVDKDKDYFKAAPKINDYLTEESKNHFNEVLKGLDSLGIKYEVDPLLVRGLDYYTYTVFEIEADIKDFGAQNVICAGGRYNNLVKSLGGPDTPAVGLAFGMERLLLALEAEGKNLLSKENIHIYFIALGKNAMNEAQRLMNVCRSGGLKCDMDYLNSGLKAQFKKADKNNAIFTAILGDDEIANNRINVKNNLTDIQETININDIYPYVINYINSQTNSKCMGCKEKE